MHKIKRFLCAALAAMLLISMFSGCADGTKSQTEVKETPVFSSFRDIPGITPSEIKAIEDLQSKDLKLIFGSTLNTELFVDINGKMNGYTVHLCEWLTQMLGIEIVPAIYDWSDIISKMDEGEIAFSNLSPTEERLKIFCMTETVANRMLKVMRLDGSREFKDISSERPIRYVFLKGATSTDLILNTLEPGTYEYVTVDNYDDIHKVLEIGKDFDGSPEGADAYIGIGISEASFDEYGDVHSETFLPLMFSNVSMATKNPEFEPIISVVNKALKNGETEYLNDLYDREYEVYKKNKFFISLTEEEREYVKNHTDVTISAVNWFYPICFYNKHENDWEGIAFDAFENVTKLTGINFVLGNDENSSWAEIYEKLESREIPINFDLIYTPDRANRYVWSEQVFLSENYALISKESYPNISLNKVLTEKIGLMKSMAYTEMFNKWFPDAKNVTLYQTQDDAFNALESGEINLLMAGTNTLLSITNYYEYTNYKANIIFDERINYSTAFSKDEPVLFSVVEKALRLVDIQDISEHWVSKVYDYQSKLLQAQRPWLVGVILLSLAILILVTVFLILSTRSGKRLASLVKKRTQELEEEKRELAFQTTMLNTMFNAVPALVFCKDKNFKYIRSNKQMTDYFGLGANSMEGKSDRENLAWQPEECIKLANEMDRKVLNESTDIVFEEVLRSAAGEDRIFEVVKAPLILNGETIGIMGIAYNITERKEMEKELAIQKNLLEAIFYSIPDMLFIKNLDLRFLKCNKVLEEFFDVSEKDIIGKTDSEALNFHAEKLERFSLINDRVIKYKEKVCVEECLVNSKGKKVFFEVIISPLMMDGEVIGVICISRDITKRKDLETRLFAQADLLQAVIDAVPDAVFCKDSDRKYTLYNDFFANFAGLDKTSGIGKGSAEVFKVDFDGLNQEIIESRENIIIEKWMCSVQGDRRLFQISEVPFIQNGKAVGIVGIAHDITELKEMQEAAFAASRSKSAFLANMSHEIRTPLNVIIGLSDLIIEENHLAKHVSENMQKISSAGATLLSIVNDILDISKIESGKLNLMQAEYYISSLLNDVTTLVTTRISEKPVNFRLNIDNSLPRKLYGDDLRVKQILNNLLSNATKHTSTGFIELTVNYQTDGVKDVWLEFTVTDTGSGIRKEYLKDLFVDYYQVEDQANRRIEGTGLGLSITKRLTEMMDGEISVESEYGKGSSFRARIRQGFVGYDPIGPTVANSLRKLRYSDEKGENIKKLERIDLRNARVLVVDDMQTNLDVAVGLLRKYKMQVDCVTNGREAVDRIRYGKPYYNAIFMDHMMPEMDGLEATDAIRALRTEYAKHIPIIALTANAIQGAVNIFYEHDFQDFVSKPIDISQLDYVVRKWIRNVNNDVPVSDGCERETAETVKIDIPCLSVEKGISLCGEDEKVYIGALRSFVNDMPDVVDKIRNITQDKLNSYVVNLNMLKRSAANIGAETVQTTVDGLEQLIKAGDFEDIMFENENFVRDIENLTAAVKTWLMKYDEQMDE